MTRLFDYHFHRTGFWLAIKGQGISVEKRKLYFSERNGFSKYIKIGPFVIITIRVKQK